MPTAGCPKTTLNVVASEAKQSRRIVKQQHADCFVALAPRNDRKKRVLGQPDGPIYSKLFSSFILTLALSAVMPEFFDWASSSLAFWIPACAGMTDKEPQKLGELLDICFCSIFSYFDV
jgi:hypothetical protein